MTRVRRVDPRRDEQGLALVTVIIVLVALALVATPFALSMRHLESSALLGLRQEQARQGALLAAAAARAELERSHPALDLDSPHLDTLAELVPEDLAERHPDLLGRDPRGALRSVAVADESGKVHLGTATPALLGNLLGGRTLLTERLEADDHELVCADTRGFPATGLAFVGGEQIEYSTRRPSGLGELGRGFSSANLARSVPADHEPGSELLDARLLLLVQRAWHLLPGSYEPYRRVDGLRDLTLFAELTYDADSVDRVRPWVTVHGGAVAWRGSQPLEDVVVRADGGQELVVADGSGLGPGAVLRLTDATGERRWDLVLEAVDWGDHWRIRLLEGGLDRGWLDDTRVEVRVPVAVNVNTAPRPVLVALVEGLGQQPVTGVLTAEEAVHLALRYDEWGLPPDDPGFAVNAAEDLARGRYDPDDMDLAAALIRDLGVAPGELPPADLALALEGGRSRRPTRRIGRATAERVATALAAAPLASPDQLRERLDGLVADGDLLALHRDLILINAANPHDARLVGGTAPLRFDSAGLFEVVAGASENLPNGKELARAGLRQVLSVAPSGESARLLATQADFEAHRVDPARDGWTSHPNPQRAGPGGSPAGLAGFAADDPRRDADWFGAQALARATVDRAGALLAGRPGASEEGLLSRLEAASVRSSLPGTLHFDEGALGLTGSSPDGWELADGPVRIPVGAVDPPVASPTTGMLRPFSVSFWFELDDPAAETILFDTGSNPLEDRVLLMMRDGELVLRVADTSAADVENDLPEGQLPPAGEIRYGFDDGLELRAGVPYHVLAQVGGGRSTQLALFVDGLARGRRSFTTRLMDDLPSVGGPFLGSSAALGKLELPVADASSFPRRGAVRVGNEIMEYTDRTEDSLVVAAETSAETFGGRARRGTFGHEHFAGEVVELVGYSMALVSEVASQGDGGLSGELAPFTLGMVSPALGTSDGGGEEIQIFPLANGIPDFEQPYTFGWGLGSGTNTIPVTDVNGNALPEGVFQANGGHAILFCDLGNGAVVGQTISAEDGSNVNWTLPPTTVDDEWLGGAEVIRYGRYANGELQQVSRAVDGGNVPDAAGGGTSGLDGADQAFVARATSDWNDPRVFPVMLASHVSDSLGVNENVRVIVMPISVAVDDGLDAFEAYDMKAPGDDNLVQVGLDFPEGGGGTEWIRFDTATTDSFLVRDDEESVENGLQVLANQGVWDVNVVVGQATFDAVNDQLQFRGQAGTPDTTHPTNEQVLPVTAWGEYYGAQVRPALGSVGRHDQVTLVGADGVREIHTVNHASFLVPGHVGRTLVAFREGVRDTFVRSEFGEKGRYDVVADYDLEASLVPGGPGERLMEELGLASEADLADAVRRMAFDSRRLTRLVKGPSPELPSLAPGLLHLGEDFDQRPSQGGGRLDELRLHAAGPPGPLVPPAARYALAEDLLFEEEQVLVLDLQRMLYPHGSVQDSRFGPERLETMGELPPFGGLLLIGEEIVAYAGYDHLDSGAAFLAGRGLYGTERGHHPRHSPVTPLVAWPVAPLADGIGPDDDLIPLADPGLFPPGGGLLWIDNELLAYDRVEAEGLSMPTLPGRQPVGLYRGRFGTTPADHRAGAMVRWQPTRLWDGALLGSRAPQSRVLDLGVSAPGAFFTDVALKVADPDPTVELVARAVVDGRGDQHDDPQETAGVVALERSTEVAGQWSAFVGDQGDRLDLLLAPRWLPGAFDPLGGSNGWKLSPVVLDVVIRHIQPTLVLEHEEW